MAGAGEEEGAGSTLDKVHRVWSGNGVGDLGPCRWNCPTVTSCQAPEPLDDRVEQVVRCERTGGREAH